MVAFLSIDFSQVYTYDTNNMLIASVIKYLRTSAQFNARLDYSCICGCKSFAPAISKRKNSVRKRKAKKKSHLFLFTAVNPGNFSGCRLTLYRVQFELDPHGHGSTLYDRVAKVSTISKVRTVHCSVLDDINFLNESDMRNGFSHWRFVLDFLRTLLRLLKPIGFE